MDEQENALSKMDYNRLVNLLNNLEYLDEGVTSVHYASDLKLELNFCSLDAMRSYEIFFGWKDLIYNALWDLSERLKIEERIE